MNQSNCCTAMQGKANVCFGSKADATLMAAMGRVQPFQVNLNERQEKCPYNPKTDGPLSATYSQSGMRPFRAFTRSVETSRKWPFVQLAKLMSAMGGKRALGRAFQIARQACWIPKKSLMPVSKNCMPMQISRKPKIRVMASMPLGPR